ncbi:hypothetical protein Tco_0490500 [Tanacetum coccineum]
MIRTRPLLHIKTQDKRALKIKDQGHKRDLNDHALWGDCPYQPTIVTIPVVPVIADSPAVPERTSVETILTMSPKNKAHYESEKEEIHLLLTGIGDEIYLTVDACKIAHEMWIAIERIQQGESLNIQDVKTNLFWEFGKFTSHDVSSTTSTIMVKEVNEIRAERIAKNANPLALVVAASPHPDPYYQAPKKPKQMKDSTYHKEMMLLCKQAENGVPLQAEQADWLEDTDEEIDEQELKAHYNFMEKI